MLYKWHLFGTYRTSPSKQVAALPTSEQVTDLISAHRMKFDWIDFLAFKSQGKVCLLFWQTDDYSSLKQQVVS